MSERSSRENLVTVVFALNITLERDAHYVRAPQCATLAGTVKRHYPQGRST